MLEVATSLIDCVETSRKSGLQSGRSEWNPTQKGGETMTFSRRRLALLALAVAVVPTVALVRARGSDHADTPAIAAMPGADLTDVYIFPSPLNPNNVVLVMNVHPLIPSGQANTVVFDPNVLYQFKIDNTGDNVEDLVIQAKFTGTGPNQTFQIAGPVKPTRTGTVTQFETPDAAIGTINASTATTLANGAQVWCGAREDPFFFDLAQFFTILPDRANPLGATVQTTGGTTVSTT